MKKSCPLHRRLFMSFSHQEVGISSLATTTFLTNEYFSSLVLFSKEKVLLPEYIKIGRESF